MSREPWIKELYLQVAQRWQTGRAKYDKSRFCVKCKIGVGNIVIRHAVYCRFALLFLFLRLILILDGRKCFTPLQTTKFKRALEPCINSASASSSGPRRTLLKATGDLLIGFSGGLGSTVLLDLVRRCYYSSRAQCNVGHDRGEARGGSKHPRNQSVWTGARICYVEICGAFPESKVSNAVSKLQRLTEISFKTGQTK